MSRAQLFVLLAKALHVAVSASDLCSGFRPAINDASRYGSMKGGHGSMSKGNILSMIAVSAVSLLVPGCATKKDVREAVAPVQKQVDEVGKKTQENTVAIGDLDRNIARVDEKTMEAQRNAAAAQQAAERAAQAAAEAGKKADAANGAAQQANAKAADLERRLADLNNYKLMSTDKVYFRVGKSALDDKSKATLDRVVESAQAQKHYAVEVEGFADPTGGYASNVELSRRRADSVVRYLVEHNIPLYRLHDMGAGPLETPQTRTREGRREARRVEVRFLVFGEEAAQAQPAPPQQ
jgi:outer membrane protein OmpA-like peptidoglycan-associated protein